MNARPREMRCPGNAVIRVRVRRRLAVRGSRRDSGAAGVDAGALSRIRPLPLLLLACAAIPLAGCAVTSYAGIPLAEGAADPELQSLARRARGGDRFAQLDLGIRYEEGISVPVSLRRAERLYAKAAANSGGPMWVYSPPVGREKQGTVFQVDRGMSHGLREAQERLERLRARLRQAPPSRRR